MKTEVGRNWYRWIHFNKLKGGLFGIFVCDIQHCFICRPSDSTESEDAGIEPGQLRLRHWLSYALTTWLDLIHILINCLVGKCPFPARVTHIRIFERFSSYMTKHQAFPHRRGNLSSQFPPKFPITRRNFPPTLFFLSVLGVLHDHCF